MDRNESGQKENIPPGDGPDNAGDHFVSESNYDELIALALCFDCEWKENFHPCDDAKTPEARALCESKNCTPRVPPEKPESKKNSDGQADYDLQQLHPKNDANEIDMKELPSQRDSEMAEGSLPINSLGPPGNGDPLENPDAKRNSDPLQDSSSPGNDTSENPEAKRNSDPLQDSSSPGNGSARNSTGKSEPENGGESSRKSGADNPDPAIEPALRRSQSVTLPRNSKKSLERSKSKSADAPITESGPQPTKGSDDQNPALIPESSDDGSDPETVRNSDDTTAEKDPESRKASTPDGDTNPFSEGCPITGSGGEPPPPSSNSNRDSKDIPDRPLVTDSIYDALVALGKCSNCDCWTKNYHPCFDKDGTSLSKSACDELNKGYYIEDETTPNGGAPGDEDRKSSFSRAEENAAPPQIDTTQKADNKTEEAETLPGASEDAPTEVGEVTIPETNKENNSDLAGATDRSSVSENSPKPSTAGEVNDDGIGGNPESEPAGSSRSDEPQADSDSNPKEEESATVGQTNERKSSGDPARHQRLSVTIGEEEVIVTVTQSTYEELLASGKILNVQQR